MSAPTLPEVATRVSRAERDIDELKAAIMRSEAAVSRSELAMANIQHAVKDVPELMAKVADLNLDRARQSGETSRYAARLSAGAAVAAAVLALMGNWALQRATKPEPPPIFAPRLTAEEIETLRLLERRDGYRPGQRPPGPTPPQAPEPIPPSAPAARP